MNVVTHAGAVRGIVVVAVHHNLVALPEGDLQHDRNDVRFGIVVLAELLGGTAGVEVAQVDGLRAVDLAVPVQHPLKTKLRFPVGIGRRLWLGFTDRDGLGLAIGRAGGGEDDAADISLEHSRGQVNPALQVVLEVHLGAGHRFRDQRVGGKMHHRVGRDVRHGGVNPVGIAQIALDQSGARIYGTTMAPL